MEADAPPRDSHPLAYTLNALEVDGSSSDLPISDLLYDPSDAFTVAQSHANELGKPIEVWSHPREFASEAGRGLKHEGTRRPSTHLRGRVRARASASDARARGVRER